MGRREVEPGEVKLDIDAIDEASERRLQAWREEHEEVLQWDFERDLPPISSRRGVEYYTGEFYG